MVEIKKIVAGPAPLLPSNAHIGTDGAVLQSLKDPSTQFAIICPKFSDGEKAFLDVLRRGRITPQAPWRNEAPTATQKDDVYFTRPDHLNEGRDVSAVARPYYEAMFAQAPARTRNALVRRFMGLTEKLVEVTGMENDRADFQCWSEFSNADPFKMLRRPHVDDMRWRLRFNNGDGMLIVDPSRISPDHYNQQEMREEDYHRPLYASPVLEGQVYQTPHLSFVLWPGQQENSRLPGFHDTPPRGEVRRQGIVSTFYKPK